MKGLLIAGDRSGSGKTSITLALAALLRKRFIVQTFKVGMDYIDPSYLTGVTGRPCRNLDGYVMTADEIIVGGGQFTTDTDGYTAMRDYGRQWPERVCQVRPFLTPFGG